MSDDTSSPPTGPSGILAELARHLVGRDRSAEELRARLAAAGHAPPEIAAALDDARERSWIDDARLARDVVLRSAGRGRGRARVVAELVARGVDKGEAESAWDLAAAAGEIDADATLARAVERFRARGGGERERRRLYTSLLRAGFEEDQILRAVGDCEEPRGEDETE